MDFGKLEKWLLTICIISVMACVGHYVKDGFKTYETKVEQDNTRTMITVNIDGEVEKPGTYKIVENSRVCDLIYLAGGITHSADLDGVDIDAILTEGMKIIVPAIRDESLIGAPVVNINTADANELMLVPGIGEELSKRIVEYRKSNGNFLDVEDILRVRGLGDKTFEKIREYIKTED